MEEEQEEDEKSDGDL